MLLPAMAFLFRGQGVESGGLEGQLRDLHPRLDEELGFSKVSCP